MSGRLGLRKKKGRKPAKIMTVGEVTIPPAKLITVDIKGDGGGDELVRETGSTRQSGSLTTLGTRSGSADRSLAMGRGNGGGFPMDHAEDVVHTGRRVIERHADWLVWLVSVGGSG